MGIHYDYKSKRGERAMLKQAKREERLAKRRAKNASEEIMKKLKFYNIQIDSLRSQKNPHKKKYLTKLLLLLVRQGTFHCV